MYEKKFKVVYSDDRRDPKIVEAACYSLSRDGRR